MSHTKSDEWCRPMTSPTLPVFFTGAEAAPYETYEFEDPFCFVLVSVALLLC